MLTALLLTQLVLAQPAEAPVRRFALIVGANNGGRERVTLRYAGTDAQSIAGVMTQLGGVRAVDLVTVAEPTSNALTQAFDVLAQRLIDARAAVGTGRQEVIFYYSGHSDETALLLGAERFGYDQLRRRLETLPAEVRVAIVDACASGALTRAKGGISRPPFLVDASSQLKGHAFLTSASIDEAAQESERLKASVFTHALVSGLRGAADTSHDGRVTLAEAYQFAFSETLARTASTVSGPQRPAFDIQLVGTGEMVLTDVRVASAQVELESTLTGRVFVLNASGGLVVEVAKAAGAPLQLGVEPGAYRVLVDDGKGGMGETSFAVAEHQTRTVDVSQLTPTVKQSMQTRGEVGRRQLFMDVWFAYPLGIGGWGKPVHTNFSLGVLTAREGSVRGLALSSLGTWVDEELRGLLVAGVASRVGSLDGLGISSIAQVATGDARGLTLSVVNIVGGASTGGQVGLLDITGGALTGVQLGLLDVAGEGGQGAQLGLLAIAGAPFVGAQLGLLNIGGDVQGLQLGLLNIAKSVKGVQLGLLNISESTTVPIGLLSAITRDGKFRASLWGGETNVLNLALKLGSRHVYSYGIAGLNPREGWKLELGLGLGVQLDFGKWYGQLEAHAGTMNTFGQPWTGNAFVTNQRLAVGYHFTDSFSVFAGPQFTQMVSFNGTDLAPVTPWGFSPSKGVRLVPGVVAGVQLF